MRGLLRSAAFLTTFCAAYAALGCGDGPVDSGKWALDRRAYSGVYGLPILSPANDSRLNLRLLMRELHPAPVARPAADHDADILSPPLFSRAEFSIAHGAEPPEHPENGSAFNDTAFSDSEGFRCVSEAAGRAAFAAAAQSDPALSADERKMLIDARAGLAAACETPSAAPPAIAVASPRAREFAAYVAAAAAFYRGDFDAALAGFGPLAKSGDPWLAETARYMLARTALNKAQVGAFPALDGAAEPAVSDHDALVAAEKGLQAYLADFPKGRYAASARGLLRRVYWLGGDKPKLAAEYGWQIAHLGDAQANLDPASLAQEIDSKYLDPAVPDTHDPILLAVEDLMRMRKEPGPRPVLKAEQIKDQAADFAGYEDLFAYLLAAQAFYVEGDAAAALEKLGSATLSRFGFTREALRGQALIAAGRGDEATAHWRAMMSSADRPWEKEAVELGLALDYERAGSLNKAFEGPTRLSSSRLRAVLLRYAAGPILLREAIANPLSTEKERSLARFVLLYKEATRGQYKNFLRDFTPEARKDEQSVPGARKPSLFAWPGSRDPFPCPALTATMSQLAADPEAARARLCLAEFVRQSDLEDYDLTHPGGEELGGGKPIFPGAPYALSDVYSGVVAQDSAPANERAYALYRLVNCYARSGYNHCGGKDATPAQRKAWFQLLKTKFADTTWAKSQQIYW